MLRRVSDFLVAAAVTSFYWLYSRFWILEHRHLPPHLDPTPHIYAHWHGDELLLISRFRTRIPMAVMVSRSQDGEKLRRMLHWFGYRIVRGSSSRGGAGGLKGLIDAVNKDGLNASLSVDGPRGPIYKVKPGIIELARATGRPIIAGAGAAQRRFVLKRAWNKAYFPLPFSRCAIVYGKPLVVPKESSEEELEALRLQLENQLISLKAEAESIYGV